MKFGTFGAVKNNFHHPMVFSYHFFAFLLAHSPRHFISRMEGFPGEDSNGIEEDPFAEKNEESIIDEDDDPDAVAGYEDWEEED